MPTFYRCVIKLQKVHDSEYILNVLQLVAVLPDRGQHQIVSHSRHWFKTSPVSLIVKLYLLLAPFSTRRMQEKNIYLLFVVLKINYFEFEFNPLGVRSLANASRARKFNHTP